MSKKFKNCDCVGIFIFIFFMAEWYGVACFILFYVILFIFKVGHLKFIFLAVCI